MGFADDLAKAKAKQAEERVVDPNSVLLVEGLARVAGHSPVRRALVDAVSSLVYADGSLPPATRVVVRRDGLGRYIRKDVLPGRSTKGPGVVAFSVELRDPSTPLDDASRRAALAELGLAEEGAVDELLAWLGDAIAEGSRAAHARLDEYFLDIGAWKPLDDAAIAVRDDARRVSVLRDALALLRRGDETPA